MIPQQKLSGSAFKYQLLSKTIEWTLQPMLKQHRWLISTHFSTCPIVYDTHRLPLGEGRCRAERFLLTQEWQSLIEIMRGTQQRCQSPWQPEGERDKSTERKRDRHIREGAYGTQEVNDELTDGFHCLYLCQLDDSPPLPFNSHLHSCSLSPFTVTVISSQHTEHKNKSFQSSSWDVSLGSSVFGGLFALV